MIVCLRYMTFPFAGLCVRSFPVITDYDKYGPSKKCFEGNVGARCPVGSLLCGGLTDEANFVYRVDPDSGTKKRGKH